MNSPTITYVPQRIALITRNACTRRCQQKEYRLLLYRNHLSSSPSRYEVRAKGEEELFPNQMARYLPRLAFPRCGPGKSGGERTKITVHLPCFRRVPSTGRAPRTSKNPCSTLPPTDSEPVNCCGFANKSA